MNNLSNILTDAGLTQKESIIYLTLLKIKTGTAYKIAKIAQLKKPTTYIILESLREKGYVLKTPSKRGTSYTAKSPDELVQNIENKLNNILQVLPHLKNIFKGNQDSINVFYYEGIQGIKELLDYKISEMKNEEIVGFFAKLDNENEAITKLTKHWASLLLKNNISFKGITPNVKITRDMVKSNLHTQQEIKFVDPKKYSSNISIDCIHGFVRIIDYKNLNGIIIENKEVSNTIKQIFEMVWEHLS
ncbi:MAG: helix-turn-helix domain-containing protein [Candidatus Magasanikbacteria bacterium]|jgi:sugar-specific transcriptional regulator TrmB